MSIYRRKCDQCHQEFKRGLRMDLLINRVSVLSGDLHWLPDDDEEHFACFCSAECMLSYIAQRMGFKEDDATISKVPEATD